jgi:hypothetical protein
VQWIAGEGVEGNKPGAGQAGVVGLGSSDALMHVVPLLHPFDLFQHSLLANSTSYPLAPFFAVERSFLPCFGESVGRTGVSGGHSHRSLGMLSV